MKHKKRGPGHPVTTGSADIPPVFFRISKAQRKTRRWRREGSGWFIGGKRINGGCVYSSSPEDRNTVYFASPWTSGALPDWVREYATLSAAKRAVDRWLAAHEKRGRR